VHDDAQDDERPEREDGDEHLLVGVQVAEVERDRHAAHRVSP
jgi:hypothetical protein